MIFLDAESRAILKEIAQLDSMSGVTRSETEILHGALKAAIGRARAKIMFMPVDKEEPAERGENKPESQSKAGYTRKGRPVQVKYPDGHRKTFSSIKSAAEDTGLSKDRVKRMSLDGTQYKGFRVKSLAEPKTRRPSGVVIIDRYDRNIAFKSAEDAAAYIGVERSALNKALYNGGSVAGYKVRAKNPREENLY
jgi:hypothetical protein